METILFVIEYNGKVTLNNEYTADVRESEPLVIEWFSDNDFIIETHRKFILNTANITEVTEARVIKVEPNIYIVRPLKDKKEKVEENVKKENHIIADHVEYSSSEIIAVKELGTLMGHVRITKFKASAGKISLAETFIATSAKAIVVPPHKLPLAFLQCVGLRDFNNARSLLSFEISDKHLATYFGDDFEILPNNYLKQGNIISVAPRQKDGFITARNITFQCDGEKIVNVE